MGKPLLLTLFLAVLLSSYSFAQEEYRIELELENFEGKEILLASYYGKSNIIIDTLQQNEKGSFIAQGDEPLNEGMYLVILPPDNKYFEFIVDKDQEFSVKCDATKPVETLAFKGSETNNDFYGYLRYINKQRKELGELHDKLDKTTTEVEIQKLETRISEVDAEVKSYMRQFMKEKPNSFLTLLMTASKPVNMPEHLKGEDADKTARYLFYKKHYFDNINLSDDRNFRTNFLFKRVEYYVQKLTPQHPDSIAISIDRMLAPMNKDGEMFRYYLVHFLNEYAKSKVVGMDAVYVYLVDKYYAAGLAPWTDEETLEKIIGNAADLRPTLIGKTAPDVLMYKKDGSKIKVSEVQSKYTVLYFWDTDCGHCKKASPKMVAFYDKFNSKGVELMAICTEYGKDVSKCWETIEERGYKWLNVVDPRLASRYKSLYNIKSTPRVFILDENKKIIMKGIGADQMEDVMDKIIEQDQKDWEERNNR